MDQEVIQNPNHARRRVSSRKPTKAKDAALPSRPARPLRVFCITAASRSLPAIHR